VLRRADATFVRESARPVTASTEALTRQMLEWLAAQPRAHAEVMEAWRSSCPRLTIWEDACIEGLIDYEPASGKVTLSPAGRLYLGSAEPAAAK